MPECTYQYGSFVFPSPRFSVEAKPEFADDGATQTGVRMRFEISGVVSATTQADMDALLVTMRCQLNQPRLTFSANWAPDGSGPITYFQYAAADDLEFGPKPGPLTIGKVSGGLAAVYGWSVEVKCKECFSETCVINPLPQQILSLTRSYEHQVDDNGFTRRTVSGRLEIASASITVSGAPADSFRGTILNEIPLPKGYQRTSQTFTSTPDGRTLNYSIVDQEVMWTLPPSITSGRASFTVRSAPMEAMQEYWLRGRFAAPATVSKATIVTAILNLAIAKIPISSATLVIIPQAIELTEDVYGNAIDFNITCTGAGSMASSTTLAIPALNTIGGKPAGTTQQAQFVGPYGGDGSTGNSGVVASPPIIFDPCKPTLTAGSYQSPMSATLTYDQNTPNSSTGQTPDPDYSDISTDHAKSPYIDHHEEISYSIQNNAATFLPKQAGSVPIIQYTAVPTMLIYQAGYSSRLVPSNNSADLPTAPPTEFASNANVISASITPASGRPFGLTGWDIYTVRWNYLLRYNGSLPSDITNLGMAFPDDPRRSYLAPNLFSSGNPAPALVDA